MKPVPAWTAHIGGHQIARIKAADVNGLTIPPTANTRLLAAINRHRVGTEVVGPPDDMTQITRYQVRRNGELVVDSYAAAPVHAIAL